MFIEIEGIDGAGKSTQCKLLKEWLDLIGKDSIIVKELDSTDFSKQIRNVLIADIMKDAHAEMFLFLSCKCQVFSQLIRPSMESGKIVIGDRGSGSFISYNSSILGVEKDVLINLLEMCSLGDHPNTTILLDVSVEIAQERIMQKDEQTRFDSVSMDILQKQREKFLELSENYSDWVIIDGAKSIQDIHRIIKDHVVKFMGET
jgi:dTMP kinase